jgi:hypothetical protein
MSLAPRAIHVALCLLLLCGARAWAKGSDGLVVLEGTVQRAVDGGDNLSFDFTGRLSFKFFTAAWGEPRRRQLDLDFEVRDLRVVVPAFGERTNAVKDPYVVNFENAVRHSVAASKSGETVRAVLFSPTLSFNISGIIEKVTCTHAQVLPTRFERRQ